MPVNTVNISFQDDLLRKIDKIAKEESRSRSELIREAARMYIEKKSRWSYLFKLGDKVRKETGLSEDGVLKEIRSVREQKA
ncbi:MAG: ribbon-helix-helix protein, CopG family [Dissulfurispiraceae bacterium]|nr:ribbon-helix-helix protein, CopG family [Dissulfurispiraceae bacterium]